MGKKPHYIEVFERNGQWYWHRKAGNHEIVSNGEGYTSRGGAIKGAVGANGLDTNQATLLVEDNKVTLDG